MNIGTLEFEFLANIARLRQDMDEAKKAVGSAGDFIQGVADGAKKALAGLAAGLTVGAFAGWIKGAIDAADETSKMAQRMGVATNEVGGLKLAFELGGSSAEGMTAAFAKLSKNAAENNEAFKALGVATRNADGTLRPTKDLFYDVADAFKGMEDGAVKSARAQEIFGKSGAELIPLLNGGADGLREMAEMAEKLGLVIDENTGKAAEQFNDTLELVHKAAGGVANQLMAKMLPALNSVVGGMLEYITKGDIVTKTADAIGVALKGVYTAAVVIGEVLTTIAKTGAAAFAQLALALKGDFKGAMEVGKQWTQDIKKDWTNTVDNLGKVWDDTAGKTVENLGKVEKATKGATFETKEQKKAVDEAAKAYESFNKKLQESHADLQRQVDGQDKLTVNQKLLAELTANSSTDVQKLTEKRRLELIETAKQNVALEEQVRQRTAEKKWLEETGKENDKYREGIEKQTDSIWKQVAQMKESNATIGLSREELGKLEQQKLLDAAAQAERNAQDAEAKMLGEELVNEYKSQAEGLRELAKLKGDKVHLEAAKEANEAWKATTEEIGKSFTDSLFRAFEEGKSFSEAFMSSLKNLFKTTVLKLLIQPVQAGMNNMIGSFFGMGSGSGAGSGSGSGGFGGLGNFLSGAGDKLTAFSDWMGADSTIGQWAGKAGSWLKGGSGAGSMFGNLGGGWSAGTSGMAAGNFAGTFDAANIAWNSGNYSGAIGTYGGMAASAIGGFMAGRGVGQAISNGYSAIGGQSGNSAVNTGAAVGAAIGSIIPGIGTMIGGLIGGALGGLVNRAFGHKAKEYNGDKGISGTLGGDAGLSGGQSWADWTQKGGWFRSDKHGTDTFGLDQQTADALAEGAKAVKNSTKAWAESLGLPAARLDAITATFRVKMTDNEAENQKVLAGVFADYATQLTNSFADLVKPFQRAGETVSDTLQRLSAIQEFSKGINEFGGIFSSIAKSSIEAKEQLVGFAGGIEAFLAKTQAFVDQYYTQGEKAGLQSAQLLKAFESIGIDASGLSKREDFRALVESQNVNTEEGRKTLAALLDLGPIFAGVADYLKENNQTLADAAAAAPQVEALQGIFEQQQQANATQEQLVTTQEEANGLLGDIYGAISEGNGAVSDAIVRFGDALDRFGGYMSEFDSRPIVQP